MRIFGIRRHPALIASILIFLGLLAFIAASSYNTIKNGTSTLSGRVVNMNGYPISKCRLAIQPIDIINGEMCLLTSQAHQLQTDSDGFFRFDDILPGRAQFVVTPETVHANRDVEIQSINFAGISFLRVQTSKLKIGQEQIVLEENMAPQKMSSIGGIPFYIKSGLNIKNITITVSPRMCIRGKILLSNGEPLANAESKLNLQYQSLDGHDSGSLNFNPTYTDSDGYFVKYVNLPIIATVSVEYNGAVATSDPIKISAEQRRHDIVFNLDTVIESTDPDK